jgi:hypothetical protein
VGDAEIAAGAGELAATSSVRARRDCHRAREIAAGEGELAVERLLRARRDYRGGEGACRGALAEGAGEIAVGEGALPEGASLRCQWRRGEAVVDAHATHIWCSRDEEWMTTSKAFKLK